MNDKERGLPMRGEGGELSLEQWVGQLPDFHRGAKEYRTLLSEVTVKTRLIDEAFNMLRRVARKMDDQKDVDGFEMYVMEELQPFMDVEITQSESVSEELEP